MALDDIGGSATTAAPVADASGFLGGTPTPTPAPTADAGAAGGDFLAPAQEISGGADPDWYGSLSTEAEGEEPAMRDWIKAAGVKDINALAKIARDNQRALRDSGRVKVPGEGASEAETAAFRKAIGVPDAPTEYAMPTVTGADGQPLELDTARLGEIAGIAHKHGIPKAALEGVLQELAQGDALRLASAEADMQAKVDDHLKTWGDKKAEKIANVTAAARELGLSREEQQALRTALGPARALDLFADLGSRIAEDSMTMAGSPRNFGLSGAEAQKTIDAKMANTEWRTKAMVPGTAERAEFERLQNAVGAAADRAVLEAMRS